MMDAPTVDSPLTVQDENHGQFLVAKREIYDKIPLIFLPVPRPL
jgi:hypothetical protein